MASIQNNKLFVHVPARKGIQAGVIIIYPCGTRRWVGESWYVDIDIKKI